MSQLTVSWFWSGHLISRDDDSHSDWASQISQPGFLLEICGYLYFLNHWLTIKTIPWSEPVHYTTERGTFQGGLWV